MQHPFTHEYALMLCNCTINNLPLSSSHLANRLVLSTPHTMLNRWPCPRCLRTRPAIASSFLSTPSIDERIRLRTCKRG